MINLDVIAHHHPFRAKSLALKAFATLCAMALLFWKANGITTFTIILISVWVMGQSQLFKWPTYFKGMLAMVLVLGLSAISLLISISWGQGGSPLITLSTSNAEIHLAQTVFLRSFGCFHGLMAYAYSTPMPQTLKGLLKLGIPKTLLRIFETSYRFIFILLEEAAAIHQAQTLRLGHQTPLGRLKSLGQLIGSLLNRVVSKAHQQYISSLLKLGE